MQKGKTFEELKKELGEGNIPMQEVREQAANGVADFSDVPKYSYEELSVDSEELPSGVDPAAREVCTIFFFIFKLVMY